MPGGNKEGGGLEVKKEYKSKGMPYAPFKMSGHTLPGPNQRTPAKNVGNIAAAAPPEDFFTEQYRKHYKNNPGTDPNSLGAKMSGYSLANTQVDDSTQTPADSEYVDTGMDDSSTDTLATGGDTAKKKVDVEVTVNDKKI